jgi:hypothetical protein
MVTAVLVSQLEVGMEYEIIRKKEKKVGSWQLVAGILLIMFAVVI